MAKTHLGIALLSNYVVLPELRSDSSKVEEINTLPLTWLALTLQRISGAHAVQ
jgi:hypothetical protein